MSRPKKKGNKPTTRNPNGMGSFYKRANGRIEWKQMTDGAVRYASSMNLGDLSHKIKRISGTSITGDKTKLFDWLDRWLEKYVKILKKPSTYSNYYFAVTKYIKIYMKNVQLRHITQSDVQDLIGVLIKKGYSVPTIKNVRKALSAAYISAIEDEHIVSFNPTRGTKIPKGKPPTRKTFNITELVDIITRLATSRWLYGILFMLATGLRRGELLGLKWTDIDFKEKRIIIKDNLTQYDEGTPKDDEYHSVPLTEHAITYLAGWKNQLRKENNPALYGNVETIFVSKFGRPLRPNSLNNLLDKRKFGFRVTPHMFRHTFVYLSKNKISLDELKEALGHSRTTTTLDIYGILLPNTVAVADKIEAAYNELDEAMETIKKKDQQPTNVIDFTKKRMEKLKLS